MKQAIRKPTTRQLGYLAFLGYAGPQPTDIKDASDRIQSQLVRIAQAEAIHSDLDTTLDFHLQETR